jgi:hypothetical protein
LARKYLYSDGGKYQTDHQYCGCGGRGSVVADRIWTSPFPEFYPGRQIVIINRIWKINRILFINFWRHMEILWNQNQWETFFSLAIFLKILVTKEIIDGKNSLSTLKWVVSSSTGHKTRP